MRNLVTFPHPPQKLLCIRDFLRDFPPPPPAVDFDDIRGLRSSSKLFEVVFEVLRDVIRGCLRGSSRFFEIVFEVLRSVLRGCLPLSSKFFEVFRVCISLSLCLVRLPPPFPPKPPHGGHHDKYDNLSLLSLWPSLAGCKENPRTMTHGTYDNLALLSLWPSRGTENPGDDV